MQMPEVPITIDSIEQAAADSELLMTLEQYMSEWSSLLATVMQRESEKQPQGQGPLAEIEFWRARNAVLSSIYEQLNLPNVGGRVLPTSTEVTEGRSYFCSTMFPCLKGSSNSRSPFQVKKMIAVVELGSDDRNLMASFKSQMGELTKLAAEARDNVKFLTTLERHFKNVAGGPLSGILDTLPPMMNALRMVRYSPGSMQEP